MKERQCWRCGKEFPLGDLTYVVNIRVFAGFDGVLVEAEEGVDQSLKQILEQIHRSDPEELEREVYEEWTFLLCKSCRDRFVDETRHPWEGPIRFRKESEPILH